MRLLISLLLLFWGMAGAASRPEAAIPYFTNVREVRIAEPGRQNFIIVDEELWNHSRPDLADLRLYDEQAPVQYALSEQRAGVSSEEASAKILNLGAVAGHTEFDVDVEGIPEYDRVRLRLDAHDFVATASVSAGNALGKTTEVKLPPSTLYDFSKEQLGSNSEIKLPTSSFRYLHIRLSSGIVPQQVKAATVFNRREQQASWTKVGSCGGPQARQHLTVITCTLPPKVPLTRIEFKIPSEQVNFRRTVSIEDAAGSLVSSGEISRVRRNRGGTLVTHEDLAVNLSGSYGQITINIDNADNPPLTLSSRAAAHPGTPGIFRSRGKIRASAVLRRSGAGGADLRLRALPACRCVGGPGANRSRHAQRRIHRTARRTSMVGAPRRRAVVGDDRGRPDPLCSSFAWLEDGNGAAQELKVTFSNSCANICSHSRPVVCQPRRTPTS